MSASGMTSSTPTIIKVPGTFGSLKAPEPCVTDQLNCIVGLSSLVYWLHNTNLFTGFRDIPAKTILRLASGNLIGGESGWIAAYRTGWESYGDAVKRFIQPSALALGMKDFGAGLRQTITYMEAIGPEKFVLANTCEGWESYENGAEWDFCNITVFIKTIDVKSEVGTLPYRIGIIGFVTPIVQSTIAGSYIKTFIAIGDGSPDIARQIINNAPKVKLVIYGAGFSTTNTTNFLEEYEGSYIATAGRWGSSVGKLVFDIDENSGDLQILKKYLQVTTHPGIVDGLTRDAVQEVIRWRNNVRVLQDSNIGHSRTDLGGEEVCWREECNIGNLMTDAAVHCTLRKFSDSPFPYPLYSVWHGGAFFYDTFKGGAKISEFDVHKWLPYHNNAHIVKVQGQHLRSIFEASASGLDPVKAGAQYQGQFLQVSNGIRVHYDICTELTFFNIVTTLNYVKFKSE